MLVHRLGAKQMYTDVHFETHRCCLIHPHSRSPELTGRKINGHGHARGHKIREMIEYFYQNVFGYHVRSFHTRRSVVPSSLNHSFLHILSLQLLQISNWSVAPSSSSLHSSSIPVVRSYHVLAVPRVEPLLGSSASLRLIC